MNKLEKIFLITLLSILAFALNAANKKQISGPRGGRLLQLTEPKAEFVVEKDRAATITFYDDKNKPVPASDQSAILTAMGDQRQTIEFEKKDNLLVSKSKLPPGDPYPVILQFKSAPNARANNFRFNLDLSVCGGCKLAEYACSCHD